MTTTHANVQATSTRNAPPVLRSGRAPYVLSGLLAGAAVASAAPSLLLPELLGGTEVSNGNLRGTAIVVLAAVPLLLTAMGRSAGESARWMVVWVGSTAYLLYQAVMFCFATPFNSLFLAYVAFLGLGLYTLVALLTRIDPGHLARRVDSRMPFHMLAGVTVTFAALNGLAWLARAVPASLADEPAAVLDGSGLLTSPVWVQDLAFWIPAAAVSSFWMWRRQARGVLLVGALLVFYAVECVSIAVDQWWGVRADDTQPDWASMTMVPVFVGVAVLLAFSVAALLRHIDRT